MKNKLLAILSLILSVLVVMFWIQRNQERIKTTKTQIQWKTSLIAQDSLKKLSDGYYQKLVADTLTLSELKKVASKYVDLKGRDPVYVTEVVAKPKFAEKVIDGVVVKGDSIRIEDYYPSKEDPFLKYTSNVSIATQKGVSQFNFNSIKLVQVVTRKPNGIYQVDFITPKFIEVESLSIQSEPMVKEVKDNWGTLVGADYGRNLESSKDIIGVSVYQRYKKVYLGIGVDTEKTVKAGVKIEL